MEVYTFLPTAATSFVISTGSGNVLWSQMKYLCSSAYSMSSQRTSIGISCSVMRCDTVRTSSELT